MTRKDDSPGAGEDPYWSEELLAVLVVALGDETQARETLEQGCRARPEDEKRKLAPRRRDRWQRGTAHEIRSADETRDRGEGTQDTECPHALDMVQGQQQRPK